MRSTRQYLFKSSELNWVNGATLVFSPDSIGFDSSYLAVHTQLWAVCLLDHDEWSLGDRLSPTQGFYTSIGDKIKIHIQPTGFENPNLIPANWRLYITVIAERSLILENAPTILL